MSEIIEIIQKDVKVQNDIAKSVQKYNNQSLQTRSILGQNALIQSNIFKEAINIMGETIHDMDIEIEDKDNKISFLEKKIGITNQEVIEEMGKLNLNKISSKEKNDRIMHRLNKTLHKHKYITNKQ